MIAFGLSAKLLRAGGDVSSSGRVAPLHATASGQASMGSNWRESRRVKIGAMLLQRPRWLEDCARGSRVSSCITGDTEEQCILLSSPNEELDDNFIVDVFGYPRTLDLHYALGEVIGNGGFGIVRKAVDLATGRQWAVKSINKKPPMAEKSTPYYLMTLLTEVQAMFQLGASLNAAYLQDIYEDNRSIHLVMEMCEGGMMLDRYEQNQVVCSERTVADHMRSVFRFLAQCHTRGIIYRDVKPENFLFLNEKPGSPLKAIDFGLAVRHWPGPEKVKGRCGTPAYMAPELINGSYDSQCDMWSAGIMMYQLLLGKLPWGADVSALSANKVFQRIISSEPANITGSFELQESVSDEALDLLSGLLTHDPDQRVSAAQALEHPWIRSSDSVPDVPLHGTLMQRIQRHATYNSLKQHALRAITQHLIEYKSHPIGELRAIFRTMDTDGSGLLRLHELVDALQDLGYSVTNAELGQLVERMDLSSVDSISFLELCTALIRWEDMSPAVFDRELAHVYLRLDAERKGYLTSQDLHGLLPLHLQGEPSEVKEVAAQRIMRELDIQVDGILSEADFMRIVHLENDAEALIHYDDRLHPVPGSEAEPLSQRQRFDYQMEEDDCCCELDVEGFFL